MPLGCGLALQQAQPVLHSSICSFSDTVCPTDLLTAQTSLVACLQTAYKPQGTVRLEREHGWYFKWLDGYTVAL